jgi:hypothetical protein
MLPERVLNDKGMILDNSRSYWIEFDNQLPYKEFEMFSCELESSGIIMGKMQSSREWYAAYEFRNQYVDQSQQSVPYQEHLQQIHPGLTVQSYTVSHFNDLYNPVQEDYEVVLTDQVAFSQNTVSFRPMFYQGLEENPFQLKSRSYPVEFPYVRDILYILNLKFPENFKIDILPEDLLVTMPNDDGRFEYQTSILGNQLQVTSHIQINKRFFSPEEYTDLKQFFELIVMKHAERITFNR